MHLHQILLELAKQRTMGSEKDKDLKGLVVYPVLDVGLAAPLSKHSRQAEKRAVQA